MYVSKHIILGVIFSAFLYFVFNLTLSQGLLIFLSSFLIDFDHYVFFIQRERNFSLKKAYRWWSKDLPRNHKPMLNIFHTVEFHLLVLVLSFYIPLFLYVFIGMIFHSLLDILYLGYFNLLGCREFSLIRYLLRDKEKYF